MADPLSKRRSFLSPSNLGRRLFLLVGVFFVVLAFVPQKAEARANVFEPQAEKASPVEKNEEQIKVLKENFGLKADLVEEKTEEYVAVKEEVDKVAETKESLATEVTSLKSEIEQLKAKLEEKKRLDALRIVQVDKYASNSAGNTYAPGNCTWYVKSKRPDLPNMMGNANAWYASAKARGYRTGTMAKTNAVGVSFGGWAGHVVYVEKWLGDGKILISEMNVQGLYSRQTRIASESEFVYIYELI